MAFIFETTITVSGGDLGDHRVTIPASHITHKSGKTFIHVSTVPWWCQHLFASTCTRRQRALARTDVLDQLLDARNNKLEELLVDRDPIRFPKKSTQDSEESILPTSKCRRFTFSDKLELEKIVSVQTPKIGDVLGVSVDMWVKHKKTFPLWVELTPSFLTYVRAACNWQITNEVVKRTRAPKKLQSADESPTYSSIDIDSPAHAGQCSADSEGPDEELYQEEWLDHADTQDSPLERASLTSTCGSPSTSLSPHTSTSSTSTSPSSNTESSRTRRHITDFFPLRPQ